MAPQTPNSHREPNAVASAHPVMATPAVQRQVDSRSVSSAKRGPPASTTANANVRQEIAIASDSRRGMQQADRIATTAVPASAAAIRGTQQADRTAAAAVTSAAAVPAPAAAVPASGRVRAPIVWPGYTPAASTAPRTPHVVSVKSKTEEPINTFTARNAGGSGRAQTAAEMGPPSKKTRRAPIQWPASMASRPQVQAQVRPSRAMHDASTPPGIAKLLLTPRYSFPNAASCASEKSRVQSKSAPRHRKAYQQYHNVIVAAATPEHFSALLEFQGGWTPPSHAQAGGGSVRSSVALNSGRSPLTDILANMQAIAGAWQGCLVPGAESDVVAAVSAFMTAHRRGIFVSFRQGKLAIYQPFSLATYENRRIKRLTHEVQRVMRVNGYTKWWEGDPSRWYVNHCWLDPKGRAVTTPTEWWTTEYLTFFEHFQERVNGVAIPDVDFIINNADFPVISKTSDVRRMLPVLSAVYHPDYLDIPFLTTDDVEYVTQRVFLHAASKTTCRDLYLTPFDAVDWDDKIPTAFFRGSASGCGIDVRSNPRLQLAALARQLEQGGADDPPLLDAGVTDYYEVTPRLDVSTNEVRVMNTSRFPPVKKTTPLHSQSRYRYIINVEGYVGAFRYLFLLSSGSAIINVKCPYQMWYEPAIRPQEHVLQVRSVTDVPRAVQWCRAHDDACRTIAGNAKALHERLATFDVTSAYVMALLQQLAMGPGQQQGGVSKAKRKGVRRHTNQRKAAGKQTV